MADKLDFCKPGATVPAQMVKGEPYVNAFYLTDAIREIARLNAEIDLLKEKTK